MTTVLVVLEETEYTMLREACLEQGIHNIDECIVWVLKRFLARCHTGFNSSALSSDVSNHPPARNEVDI